jgi:NADH-quinone oxidoreductase subunit F
VSTPDTSGWDRPMSRAMRDDGQPAFLDEYLAAGGYEGLERALRELEPPAVTQTVLDSGLRGRGGAGYLTGRKWSTMPLGPDAPRPKYVACNGDEMEPGSIKDRWLMSRNPHLLIEGMAIAGYAVQADAGYIFLRAQYDTARDALERALAEARERGYLGERILGTDLSFDIYLHESVGRYICGEASSMLNALESQRPNPRARPPHMTGAGLYFRPTVVNNVESYAAVPGIVRNGVDWWKGLSASAEGGTKVFGVSGRVAKPGCIELPVGTSLRELIEVHAGGMLPGYGLRAVVPGGASTSFIPAADLDVAFDNDTVETIGSRLGTGTPVILDDQTCPIGMTLNMMQFFAQESCGWCTPCREGLQWTVQLLRGIEEGRGRPEDLDILTEHVWYMGPDRTFCDLAPGAMQPLESALRVFADDFAQHIADGTCPYPRSGSSVPVMPGSVWAQPAAHAGGAQSSAAEETAL